MTPIIEVLYSCNKCGIIDRPVQVQERGNEEDMADWMQKVQVALSADHDATSPNCKIIKFTSCKIPLQYGTKAIGKANRH